MLTLRYYIIIQYGLSPACMQWLLIGTNDHP